MPSTTGSSRMPCVPVLSRWGRRGQRSSCGRLAGRGFSPPPYTEKRGGYERMLAKHIDLGITEEQRFRFATLMRWAADDAGMPEDPEFRSALVAYLEWGTRLALGNSQREAAVIKHAPVPKWGWGEAPPYEP